MISGVMNRVENGGSRIASGSFRPGWKKKGRPAGRPYKNDAARRALAAHVAQILRHRFEPGDAFFHRRVSAE
jgi:hypothetical protein